EVGRGSDGIPVHVGEDLSRRLSQRGRDTNTDIDAAGLPSALDPGHVAGRTSRSCRQLFLAPSGCNAELPHTVHPDPPRLTFCQVKSLGTVIVRSEEHTSELQS